MSKIIIVMVLSYILGSIPFSFILGKVLKKLDLRKHGSGNVGATNALRVLGWKIGITALILDMAKGFAAVTLTNLIVPESNLLLLLSGLLVILGHIFTIFLRFKGGKGVATSAGVFAALIPLSFVIALCSFLIITLVSRYVSLGSIVAAIILIVTQSFFTFRDGMQNPELLVMVIIVSVFIIVKHRANIKRLWEGTENRISFRK